MFLANELENLLIKGRGAVVAGLYSLLLLSLGRFVCMAPPARIGGVKDGIFYAGRLFGAVIIIVSYFERKISLSVHSSEVPIPSCIASPKHDLDKRA